jgi:hypothetical protein
MASPFGIGDAIFFIEKGIEIYKKIRDAPKIFEDVDECLKICQAISETWDSF